MDNENEKPLPEKNDAEESSPHDEVPAWLQGIDHPDMDDTSPNEPIKEDEDTWVKETSQDFAETQKIEPETEDSFTPKKSLPDWLSQLSNIDTGTPEDKDLPEGSLNETSEEIDITDDMPHDSENTDELEVIMDNQIEDNDFQFFPPQDSNEDEGFIEISEFGLAEISKPSSVPEDTDISENEELPSWLNEMIAEPSDEVVEEDTVIEEQIEENEQEPTEPFDVDLEAPHFEEESTDLPWEYNLTTEDLPDEAIQDEAIQDDSMFSIIEDETQPIITQSESIDPSQSAQEIQESTQEQPEELPKTLMFAKHLLDQSEYKPAKKILTTYIDQSKFVDEISQWLQEIVNQRAENSSDVWELIGDIALLNNDPEQALTAYSQAVTVLVRGKKNVNEFD